jgi:hypothetical protein
MERDVYRELASKDRDPYLEEPRSTASYIREPSRPVWRSPFILAVAIAAAITLAAIVVVGGPKQADKIVNAPATTQQPVVPASR